MMESRTGPRETPHRRQVAMSKRTAPNFVEARVFTLDDRIVIDDYVPTQGALWVCDVCESRVAVSAELPLSPGGRDGYLTLCRACLQCAIDGIDYSLANPKADQ